MFAKFLYLFFLVSLLNAKSIKKEKFIDTAQILFDNPMICGNPFSDPIWIPVLDLCSIECDSMTEYCVENEELAQQCKPLPQECQDLIKKYTSPVALKRKSSKAEN